jgi:hypothetical protein
MPTFISRRSAYGPLCPLPRYKNLGLKRSLAMSHFSVDFFFTNSFFCSYAPTRTRQSILENKKKKCLALRGRNPKRCDFTRSDCVYDTKLRVRRLEPGRAGMHQPIPTTGLCLGSQLENTSLLTLDLSPAR